MNPFRAVGLIILLIGVILLPIGWMYSHWLTPVYWLTPISFLSIIAGVLLMLRGRQMGSGEGTSSGRLTGRKMPGDIHGYSGQMSGDSSTSWESSDSSDSGDSGGGGGGD